MPKTKISEFSATPGNNTDIDGINISEGCAPSGINDAIRELMAQLKDFQTGAAGDSFNGPVGTTTAAAGAFTTLSSTGNTTLGDAAGDTVTVNGTATFANANPTLSAGTANGVAYLNGSKVLTTGSALYFDGTNLGIGTSSPQAKLAVSNAGAAGLEFFTNYPGGGVGTYIQSYNRSGAAYVNTAYDAASHSFRTNGTERAIIDSSGNVGIGTSSTTLGKLVVVGGAPQIVAQGSVGAGGQMQIFSNGASSGDLRIGQGYASSSDNIAFISNQANADLVLRTNATERARIDSSGNLLVGIGVQLRSGDRISAVGTGTQVMTLRNDTNASGYSTYSSILQQNANNTNTYHFWGNTNAVGNWYLYGNGTTSFSSDARLKKNIETARNGYAEDLCKLRVVKYNWRNDEDGKPRELGLIAQEVEQVFPGLVQDDLNPVEAGGEIYKQIKQSVLPFMLLKAIQEQQAIINQINAKVEAQAAEIAALKGK